MAAAWSVLGRRAHQPPSFHCDAPRAPASRQNGCANLDVVTGPERQQKFGGLIGRKQAGTAIVADADLGRTVREQAHHRAMPFARQLTSRRNAS